LGGIGVEPLCHLRSADVGEKVDVVRVARTLWGLDEAAMNADGIVAINATDQLMAAVYALRRAVFVLEQGIPHALERDEGDAIATHLAALSGGRDTAHHL
jgi:hypothetical protein